MTSSKILFCLLLSFVLGIAIASFFQIPFLLKSFLLILSLYSFFLFWPRKQFILFSLLILSFLFAIFRYESFLSSLKSEKINNYLGKFVSLSGEIAAQPKLKKGSQEVVLKIGKINKKLVSKKSGGKILIITRKYPPYHYGERISLFGRAEKVNKYWSGSGNYLLKDGITALFFFPKIGILEGKGGNFLLRKIIALKTRLKESIERSLPSPQAGLLEALLFGDEENIPSSWKEKFNITGTRHITAVSGMNITIVISLLLNLFLSLGFWRKTAFYFSLAAILVYILMIGAPPSALRAAVMGFFFLLAQYLGRVSSAERSLLLAAALMLFSNPLLLRFDIGFQLSFLAILGLIYFSPLFSRWFEKIPNIFQLRYNLSSTLGAQSFTFPLLIYHFGRVVPFSILPNVLILPILPQITILGFLAAFFALFSFSLALPLFFLSWPFLTYILEIISLFAKVPFLSLNVHLHSFFFLFLSYSLLAIFVWFSQRKRSLLIYEREVLK